jgi:hypothetical protein
MTGYISLKNKKYIKKIENFKATMIVETTAFLITLLIMKAEIAIIISDVKANEV